MNIRCPMGPSGRVLPALGLLIGLFLAATDFASAQALTDLRLFEQYCTACHGNPAAPVKAPDGIALRKMWPEAVYAALSRAPHVQAQGGPTDAEKRLIAGYLGGRKVDVAKIADARLMPNQCSGNPAITDLSAKPSWNGWGADASNTRFQSAQAAGLSPDQVPNLKLKWAFGFPAAEIMWGQPSIAAGRVFIGVDTGAVYSLDAATGCVYWSYQADAGVRNAISIAPVKGQGAAQYAAYFGDVKGNVYGVDAHSGKQLWKVKVEEQPVARITGAPAFYDGRLYVPVSSSEERAAGLSATYPCCTFRAASSRSMPAPAGKSGNTTSFPIRPSSRAKRPKASSCLRPPGARFGIRPRLTRRITLSTSVPAILIIRQ